MYWIRTSIKMAALISGDTFFADQTPPDNLEETKQKAMHFAEAHVPSGRPVVLITVSMKAAIVE